MVPEEEDDWLLDVTITLPDHEDLGSGGALRLAGPPVEFGQVIMHAGAWRRKSLGAAFQHIVGRQAEGTEAGAAVVTRVDRADIELNESFTLEVITDENTDLQPDISVLEADFYIGQGSQLSNTTIVNGQIRRSKTWTYVLMPRRAGDITIPPIAVGNQQSTPLRITVSEPTYAPPGEAEVFLTSEVDFDETYVQAQVLLSIRIYRSVATRQPALRDPTVSGVEVLSELAGEAPQRKRMRSSKGHAVGDKRIDGRRGDVGISQRTDRVKPLLVGTNPQNIWRILLNLYKGSIPSAF